MLLLGASHFIGLNPEPLKDVNIIAIVDIVDLYASYLCLQRFLCVVISRATSTKRESLSL